MEYVSGSTLYYVIIEPAEKLEQDKLPLTNCPW